jgi:hypothetical protein
MKHYIGIGLYDSPRHIVHIAYVMDDFGNLVGITDDQFDQLIYFRLGYML